VTLTDPLGRARIDATSKGFPAVASPIGIADVAAEGWSFGDLRPPVMVLREDALAHNIALMATYCAERGVALAPHGKTTMAPQLWDRQLRAGAWGIAAASVGQARVMAEAGIGRILIANEVVDPGSIAWLADRVDDDGPAVWCSVDSERGLELLEDGLARSRSDHPMPVLVELGHAGGRTGCRSIGEALELSARVGRSRRVSLAGVTGYEGTIGQDRSSTSLDRIRAFLDDLRSLATGVLETGHDGELLVSAGGSAYFDLVVERLTGWPPDAGVTVLLRSGAYLTHDVGHYEGLSPFAGAPWDQRFHPAIEVWGSVLSIPEPGLAIVGLGRRDVPFDLGLPSPRWRRTSDGERSDVHGKVVMTALQDQHAFCRMGDAALEVGDLLGCGISHPCSAFDRWRAIPLVDERDHVIDAIETYF
jgi:D-serine deaminase-like pyridoxal phosphate-dependent protein